MPLKNPFTKKKAPEVRVALLQAQLEMVAKGDFQVIILLGGLEGAGRGSTINLLSEWMDPRHVQVHGMGEPTDEELDRPMMWRFWRSLPPKGKIGVFLGSWYTWPILNRAQGRTDDNAFLQSLKRARRMESMLVAEGALVVKFWLHLSKKHQKQRLKEMEKNPVTRWRVSDRDWKCYKAYDTFRPVHEMVIRHTSTPEAPWLIIEGSDEYYRNLTVGKTLLTAIRDRLDNEDRQRPSPVPTVSLLPPVDNLHLLQTLDPNLRLEKNDAKKELERYQAKLNLLMRHPKFKYMSVIAVFEGNDAAGKGGSIRRITRAMDARRYQVIPIAAPTEEERAQPYLWRFWRHLPRKGRVTIFDRSWYGRVLVERVEGFCAEVDWVRAYNEINDFESQMTRHNLLVVKYWLAITKDEQLRRFKEREQTAFKQYKITEEDWRNREKWEQYEQAVCDMVNRTSTMEAPWHLVEANDKNWARIKVIRILCESIEEKLATLEKAGVDYLEHRKG
jgi:polyphosphate:AMP phosphotransferase